MKKKLVLILSIICISALLCVGCGKQKTNNKEKKGNNNSQISKENDAEEYEIDDKIS